MKDMKQREMRRWRRMTAIAAWLALSVLFLGAHGCRKSKTRKDVTVDSPIPAILVGGAPNSTVSCRRAPRPNGGITVTTGEYHLITGDTGR